MTDPGLEGYLYKMNPRKIGKPIWKRRFFKLEGDKIYYFKDRNESKHLDYIPVHQITASHTELFTSVPEKRHLNCGFCIATHTRGRFKGRKFNLLGQNAEDRDRWVAELNAVMAAKQAEESEAMEFDDDDVSISELVDDDDDDEVGALQSTYTLDGAEDSPEEDEFDESGGYINFVRNKISRKKSTKRSMRKTHKAQPESWTVVNPSSESQNQNTEEGIGTRKRSVAVSRSSISDRPPAELPRTSTNSESGFGSGVVKVLARNNQLIEAHVTQVWLDEGQRGQRAFGITLSEGAIVADLKTKIEKTLGNDDVVELWEVTAAGVDQPLHLDRDVFAIKRSGARIFLLTSDRRILVLFFEDGTFTTTVVPYKVTAKKLIQSENPDLREKVIELNDPGLFLRSDGKDMLFHDDDRPLDVYYDETPDGKRVRRPIDEPFELGKLVMKSKSIRQRPNTLQPGEQRDRINTGSSNGSVGSSTKARDGDEPEADEPVLRSFLFKKGAYNCAWKKRWCTLQNGLVRYYRNVADRDPAGTIAVKDIADVCESRAESIKDSRYPHCFEIGTTAGRDYMFCAETQLLMRQWIQAIDRNVTNADKVGYMYKKGFNNQAWRKRWFILRGSQLSYYESQGDKTQKGAIDLAAASHVGESGLENGISIISGDRVYYLKTPNAQDRADWLRALKGIDSKLVPEKIDLAATTPSRSTNNASAFDDDDDVPDPTYLTRPARSGGARAARPAQKPKQRRSMKSDTGTNKDMYDYSRPPEPVQPLPKATINPEESRSSDFGDYQDRDWTVKQEKVQLSPALKDVMAEQDSLGSLFAARPRLLSTTKKPHDIRPLENKAAQARSSQPAPPQELDDEALERLGLDRQLNPQLAASGAVTPVDSPAVLKLLVRSLLQNSDGEPTTTRISLSGVILIHAQGQWRKDSDCDWHSVDDIDGDDRIEKFTFGPHIVAVYQQRLKRWFVIPKASSAGAGGGNDKSAPQEPQTNPVVRAWIKHGGLKFVARLHRSVEEVLTYYSAIHGQASNADRFNLLDDSKNETIGVLVRKSLCSSIAQILAHGMLPTRFAGLVKNTVWSFVQASCPKPPRGAVPTSIIAYRVMRDLESNKAMKGDDHMKFRSFICASLNHKFLEYWLADVYNNDALLSKYHNPGAFLRTCPRSVFDDLLLGLNPLMVLDFRLYTSFEIQRRMSVSRDWSPNEQRPRSQTRHPQPKIPPPQPKRVCALYDVAEPDDDELDFVEGDILTVESRVDSEWLICSLNGKKGLVPVNFVEELPLEEHLTFHDQQGMDNMDEDDHDMTEA